MEIVPVPAVLTRRVDAIRALDPPMQSEPFLAASWKSKVQRPEVEYLVDAFPDGRISRQELFTLGKAAVAGDAQDRRRLLVGTLMWGYGPKGGRSYANANKVLTLSNLDRKLDKCTEEIGAANVAGAFSQSSCISLHEILIGEKIR